MEDISEMKVVCLDAGEPVSCLLPGALKVASTLSHQNLQRNKEG